MQFPLALRYYWLLAQYAVALGTMVCGSLLALMLKGHYYNSTCFLLKRHPYGRIAVIINLHWLRGRKLPDLICRYFPVIFSVHSGKKIKPFFMGYWMVVLIFILQLILLGYSYFVLGCNINIILREILSQEVQSAWSYPPPFIKGGGRYLSRSYILQTRSAYWRMPTLKGFTIQLWVYFTLSWKLLQFFLHMIFPNSNHNSFSR